MNRLTSALVGFAVGTVAGTVVGLLYAPEKGKKTREKLSYRLKKYRDTLTDLVDDWVDGKEAEPTSAAKEEGKKLVSEATEKVEKLLNEADDLLKQMKQQKKRD